MTAVAAILLCLVLVEVRAGRHHRCPQQQHMKRIREVEEDCIDQGPPCYHCLRKITKKFGCLEKPTEHCGVHSTVMYEAVQRFPDKNECDAGYQCQAVFARWGSEYEEEMLRVAFYCGVSKSLETAGASSPHLIPKVWDR